LAKISLETHLIPNVVKVALGQKPRVEILAPITKLRMACP
jgi:hypothetical protein